MAAITAQPNTEWKHGILECCDSCSDCVLACCLPQCYAFCAAQATGENTCNSISNCIFFPLPLCCLRRKVREHHGIEGGICQDFMLAICCSCCVTVQIKRQYDPSSD